MVRLPRKPPANDNNGAPEVIPIFTSLLSRHDMTRGDCFVYGVLAAYEHAGAKVPRVPDLCSIFGIHKRQIAKHFERLEQSGLMKRRGNPGPGTTQKYELLGPRVAV